MADVDKRIWAKWQQRGIVKPKRSWRDLSREIDRMMAELRDLRPDFHGKLVHFSTEETTYGGSKIWLCVEGYWVSEGFGITKGGTEVQIMQGSVHLPENCPS